MKGGHVLARSRRIRNCRRRLGKSRIFRRTGLVKFAMRLKKTYVQKERLLRRPLQKVSRRGSDLCHVHATRRDHFVISDGGRLFSNMLHANQCRTVAVRAQPMEQDRKST